jgi:hypothetical protein
LKDPWDADRLAFDQAGVFEDEEVRSWLKAEPTSSGCLLKWGTTEGAALSRESWLFGVPLERLSGPDQVETEIVVPIVNLLRKGSVGDVFDDTAAIRWPGAA